MSVSVDGPAGLVAQVPQTINGLVAAAARTHGNATALVGTGGVSLSYTELLARIETVAGSLREHGIGAGDRVAIVLPNGVDMAVTFLAVASIAVACPLNPAYRRAEFDFFLSDLGARALVLGAAASDAREAAGAIHIPILGDPADAARAAAAPASIEQSPAAPDDVALVLHTSGTTARPKIVPLTHANLCASAANVARQLALSPADRCLNVMPLFHIHGLVGALLSSLSARASVACTGGFVSTEFAGQLRERRATWYTAVPTMHQAIVARAPHEPPPPHLRFVRSSSAALPPTTAHALARLFAAPVIEAYGMTEAAHQICANPLSPGTQRFGSVGIAAGPEVVILNEDGASLPAGTVGEVALRGTSVMRGYEGNANADAFHGPWFRTGDLGRFDADGYLYLAGRIKEIINRGGEKISPREIDEVLLQHPAVAQAVAFAMPDERLGEEVAAAVVLAPGAQATEAELTRFVAQRLADFKVPRLIVLVDEIPVGPTGKLQRIGLAAALQLPAPSAAPRAKTIEAERFEAGLAAIWCELLRLPRVRSEDDFFALGGDSILAARMLARVRDEFEREVSVATLFGRSTLAQLAAAIAASPPAQLQPPDVARPGIGEQQAAQSRPVSSAQRRLWFIQRVNPNSCVYHNVHVMRFRGALDAELLVRCFHKIVRRHESLRTRFALSNEDGSEVTATVSPSLRIDVRTIDADEEREREIVDGLARPPFDLAAGPLVRAAMLRFDPLHRAFAIVVHHIVSDRWSLGILESELAALYRAGGDAHALPPLLVAFAQSARERPDDDATRADIAYWRTHLAGDRPTLQIPADHPRPPQPSYRGAVFATTFEPALARTVTRIGATERATPFVTFLAAFCILLHRRSLQNDISIGTPVAGRSRTEQERPIGLFVNTLPLRVRLSPDATFREVVASVRPVVLDLLTHQAVPFDRLVRELLAERDPGRNPFFDVLFDFHNTPRDEQWPAQLHVETEDFDLGESRLDLSLVLRPERDGSLTCRFEYALDLFDTPTIATLAAQLRTLLEGIARDEGIAVDRLPLDTLREREKMLQTWSVPDAAPATTPDAAWATSDAPSGATIHALVERVAARTPDAPALVDADGTLSYREFDLRANRLAQALAAHGVARDVPVALFLERSATTVVAMLAVLKAGGAYLPIDPAYPPERVALMLSLAGVRTIIARRESFAELASFGAHLLDPYDAAAYAHYSDAAPQVGVAPDDLAYILYTSGSTGIPKGVATTHRAVVALLTATPSLVCRSGDTFLLQAALTFDASTFLWAPLACGARVAVMTPGPFSLAEFGAKLVEFDVTMLEATPALFHQLVEERSHEMRFLRRCLIGGDVLSPAHCARFLRDVPGCKIYNGYGPTETTVIATSHEVTLASTMRASLPIGRPIAHARTYILDRHGNPVAAGVPGELCIGGDGVARGYVGDAALTARRFAPDPFSPAAGRTYRTGDLARWLPDGEIEFLGRIDAQVKIRGFRIEPAEIEFALLEHASVSSAGVVVLGSSASERRLVAYVESGDEGCTEAGLRSFLQTKLPPHAVPSRLVPMASLPRTSGGKVDRLALSQLPPPAAPLGDDDDDAALTDVERRIAGIVQQLLGVERARRHDDFFSLGGHSLLATRVIARIAEAFGVEVSLRNFFATPTVAALAALVSAAPRPVAAPADDAIAARLATLSDADVDALLAQALRGRTLRFRCVLLGHTSLVERCAEVLRTAGHDVVGVLVPEHGDAASVEDMRACERRLRTVLATSEIDYLFSVINTIVLDAGILALVRRGAINLHDAPLPRYAGRHATTWAIAAEERFHGVTWHEMTSTVDAGAILKTRTVAIENDTAFSLNMRCYEAALESFAELVSELQRDDVLRREQDLSQRSYFTRSMRPSPACLLDWSRGTSAVDAFVRALDFERTTNPVGRPKFFIGETAYVCSRLERMPERTAAAPGTIVRLEKDGIVVAALDELVKLRAVTSLAGDTIGTAELVARHRLVPGMALRALHDLPLAEIESAEAVAIAHEQYWLSRLERLEPLVLADFERSGETSSHARTPIDTSPYAVTPIDTGRADEWATLAAFALHASSAGAGEAFDVGFRLPETRSPEVAALFASSVPLRIRPQLASLDGVARDIRLEAAETARHGTFATDISARYPQLLQRDRVLQEGALPVVVSLADATSEERVTPGAALTLVIRSESGRAELRYRPSASARRAAETIARGMAAILGARSC